MDYEKEYKRALNTAKMWYRNTAMPDNVKEILSRIFPELKESEDERIRTWLEEHIEAMPDNSVEFKDVKRIDVLHWLEEQGEKKHSWDESEDERIRKEIIETLNNLMSMHYPLIPERYNKWIAWLENLAPKPKGETALEAIDDINDKGYCCILTKQDKSALNAIKEEMVDNANKVEQPMFKRKDWITNGQYNKLIIDINNAYPFYLFKDGTTKRIKDIDEKYHLWTIQDAKDGDVLCCESGWTCIFKKLGNNETFSSYCFMDNTKWFCETGSECHTFSEEFLKAYNGKLYPATKEQRNLLFENIEEAGYEWDANNKQLIKL